MMSKTINNLNLKAIIKVTFMFALTILTSCSEETDADQGVIVVDTPIAAFTESIDATDYKLYNFTDRSTNATTYSWDFGDNTTSTDQEPSHQYAADGTYKVALTVGNTSDETDITTKTIIVVDPTAPTSLFFASVDGDNWDTYNFTNSSTNAISFAWDFGDSSTSTELSPSHTYATTGRFTITLTVTNDENVTSTSTQEIKVVDPDAPIIPEFDAVILNGSIDEESDKQANNSMWDPTVNEGLKALATKAAGITTSNNTVGGQYALKFAESNRRAYQPITVEIGVEYTIKMFIKNESADPFNVYILNTEISNDDALVANSDGQFTLETLTSSYTEFEFTFKATAETVYFYAVPFTDVSGTTEIFLDDISIETITPTL